MSLPNKPAFQKPTKSSSSSVVVVGGGGGTPSGGRWSSSYSAGVSPVRGLSPVRGTFHGVSRQEIDSPRSHTNPLFNRRTSDIARTNTPTKAAKELHKENREKQEQQWKVPIDKAQYSGKTLYTTPGKTTTKSLAAASASPMRFMTPPKPQVKRKILAENREVTAPPPPLRAAKEEDIKQVAAVVVPAPKPEVIREVVAPIPPPPSGKEDSQLPHQTERSSERSPYDNSRPKSPLVSIEELQKRIQKFLQDEGTSDDVTAAQLSSPSEYSDNSSVRRSFEESCVSGVEEASSHHHPMFAPYSPRPEFLRARKSPTPAVVEGLEGNGSPPRRGGGGDEDDDGARQERVTPTYDPKNNFLSPRPQYLRYRPLRRLELLRKSAEGTLGDLDLESPATTDVDSSRVGSEKEDGESQDVSQEVQSLKSSSDNSLHVKADDSSVKLVKPTEEQRGEIIEHNAGEMEQNVVSMKPLSQVDSEAEAHDSARLEWEEEVDVEDGEEWVEDDAESKFNFKNVLGIVSLFALVALLVVVSGSHALLPPSLHGNHISNLWRTSKVSEPVREFLQTTEGLWLENPNLGDQYVTLPNAHTVRASYLHFISLIQEVDVDPVVKFGKAVLSSSVMYSAKFGQYMADSYANLKALLEYYVEESYNSSQVQEVNEWDWVPEYDFVVPRDMFDPNEAYESIMARVETWEVKSYLASLIQSRANHGEVKRAITELGVEETRDENLDNSIERGNSSLIGSCSPSVVPVDSLLLNPSVSFPSNAIELSLNLPEHGDEKDETVLLHELSTGSPASCETSQCSTPDVVIIATESIADQIRRESDNYYPSPNVEEILLSRVMEEGKLDAVVEEEYLAQTVEEIQLSNVVAAIQLSHVGEDVQLSASTFTEDQPVPSHERLHGEISSRDGEAEGLSVLSRRTEIDMDLNLPMKRKLTDGFQNEEFHPSKLVEEIQVSNVVGEEMLLSNVAEAAGVLVLHHRTEFDIDLNLPIETKPTDIFQSELTEARPVHAVGEIQASNVMEEEVQLLQVGEAEIVSVLSQRTEFDNGLKLPTETEPTNVFQSVVTEQENDVFQEEKNVIASEGLQQTAPRTTMRSSLLHKLGHVPSLRTATALIFSSLVVAGAALLGFYRMGFFGSGKEGPPAKFKAPQQTFSMLSPEWQPAEANTTYQPLDWSTGMDYWAEDAAAVQPSSDFGGNFSTPDPFTRSMRTPERLHRNVIDRDFYLSPERSHKKALDRDFLTPDRSFKHVVDGDAFESPEMEIVEDASLGRFTALVPVVHNEGTEKEQVKLTPVRRSSRIRTRMQSSPCNLTHSSHHLCNC